MEKDSEGKGLFVKGDYSLAQVYSNTDRQTVVLFRQSEIQHRCSQEVACTGFYQQHEEGHLKICQPLKSKLWGCIMDYMKNFILFPQVNSEVEKFNCRLTNGQVTHLNVSHLNLSQVNLAFLQSGAVIKQINSI